MALSDKTFADTGGAVSDLFGAFGAEQKGKLQAEALNLRAKGDLAEAQQYDLAQKLANQNAAFTAESTAIQQAQQVRNTTLQIGGETAAIAGGGFAASGSGLDILRESASQGALAKEVLGQQGLITEAGYQEQAQSYGVMASTARETAAGEKQIASETEKASGIAAIGDIAGGLFKGAAAIATLAL